MRFQHSYRMLAGLVLGVIAAVSDGFEALPPTVGLFGAILVLSALDGIAGFTAGIGYAVPLLVGGAVTSLNSLLVVAGTVVAMTGVSLMAEMVRPLTRPPGRGWEGRQKFNGRRKSRPQRPREQGRAVPERRSLDVHPTGDINPKSGENGEEHAACNGARQIARHPLHDGQNKRPYEDGSVDDDREHGCLR